MVVPAAIHVRHRPCFKAVLLLLLRDARDLAAFDVNVVAINANDAVAYVAGVRSARRVVLRATRPAP